MWGGRGSFSSVSNQAVLSLAVKGHLGCSQLPVCWSVSALLGLFTQHWATHRWEGNSTANCTIRNGVPRYLVQGGSPP